VRPVAQSDCRLPVSETIERLAARGDGVTASGRFVAGAVPGDIIAQDGSIQPGPHRQSPPCVHFTRCGGCQLQHIDDATYENYVRDRILEALKAQGLAAPDIRPIHLSPTHSRRRASLRANKKGKQVTLGFAEASSHTLIDLNACHIMHADLFALLQPLRKLLGPLMRERRTVDVRMTRADQGIDLLIAGIDAEGLAAAEALTDFAVAHRLARLSIDEGYGPSPRYEPEAVTVTLTGVPVGLPEGAFLQATQDGETALIAAVGEALGLSKNTVDLFAGLGTFSFGMDGAVHAVEGSRDAILSLHSAAKRAGRQVSVEHRDLFRRPLTASDLERFDAVIIDPPRAGAKDQMVEIAASNVPCVASVSCNPATFARDAKELVDGGFTLNWIQPVGQFRWSTHVELVACFSRAV
jgi:23S rRNA (uracil1939-C5)-methyltransferase